MDASGYHHNRFALFSSFLGAELFCRPICTKWSSVDTEVYAFWNTKGLVKDTSESYRLILHELVKQENLLVLEWV